jgi:hypothetical protein
MNYKIYAALAEEENEGWVWLKDQNLTTRTPIKIHNPVSGRSVFCVSRRIDPNFLKRYKDGPHTCEIQGADEEKALVISEWYRDALGGLDARKEVMLHISKLKVPIWRELRAACHHPDLIARIGTRLGVLGAWLGVIGVTAPALEYLDPSRCMSLYIFSVIALVAAIFGLLACRTP